MIDNLDGRAPCLVERDAGCRLERDRGTRPGLQLGDPGDPLVEKITLLPARDVVAGVATAAATRAGIDHRLAVSTPLTGVVPNTGGMMLDCMEREGTPFFYFLPVYRRKKSSLAGASLSNAWWRRWNAYQRLKPAWTLVLTFIPQRPTLTDTLKNVAKTQCLCASAHCALNKVAERQFAGRVAAFELDAALGVGVVEQRLVVAGAANSLLRTPQWATRMR